MTTTQETLKPRENRPSFAGVLFVILFLCGIIPAQIFILE